MLELDEGAAAGALGAGALVVVLVPDELDPEEESDELELEPELDEDSEEPELVLSDLDELAAGEALLFLSRESLR